MLLEAHGLRIELPRGWSGRVFKRPAGGATLHAGDFELPLDDGEFGDQSTAVMPPGATFVALAEYVPGAGLEPGKGLFAPRRVPTTLDPTELQRQRGWPTLARVRPVRSISSPPRAGRSACTS